MSDRQARAGILVTLYHFTLCLTHQPDLATRLHAQPAHEPVAEGAFWNTARLAAEPKRKGTMERWKFSAKFLTFPPFLPYWQNQKDTAVRFGESATEVCFTTSGGLAQEVNLTRLKISFPIATLIILCLGRAGQSNNLMLRLTLIWHIIGLYEETH